MIFVAIGFVVLLFALFFLFRWTGRMGTRPNPQERARHSRNDQHGPGPRATGLN